MKRRYNNETKRLLLTVNAVFCAVAILGMTGRISFDPWATIALAMWAIASLAVVFRKRLVRA